MVVNANAYRAFLLTKAAHDLNDVRYLNASKANLRFVLNAQNPDGSWYYSTEGKRDFIDHFHTCFVMKALVKIDLLGGDPGCRAAIDKGLEYDMTHLFDEGGLPKPFSKAPRLIVYKRELYDYAECLNLLALVHPGGRMRRPQSHEWSRICSPDGSGRTDPSAAGSCCSGGTTCRCTAGRSRSCSEASAVCFRSEPQVTEGAIRRMGQPIVVSDRVADRTRQAFASRC